MGCLTADGRERVLVTAEDPFARVGQTAVAGNYAALDVGGCKPGLIASGDVLVFDLRTGGQVLDRGGESPLSHPASCDGSGIDQLVLGNDAVTAVHITIRDDNGCTCTTEKIQASDRTGVSTLDTSTEPDGSPPALTNLALMGDTLTWEHNGTARSAQLQP
jgi:hypothetical protein